MNAYGHVMALPLYSQAILDKLLSLSELFHFPNLQNLRSNDLH